MGDVKTELFIGGEARAANGNNTYVITNPARPDEVVGHAADAGLADVDATMEAAHRAQRSWASLEIGERAVFLRRIAETLNADPKLSLVKDEQFAPTLPIIAYDNEDEAVAMANDSQYGLSSSVWSSSVERARGIAERLEAGFTNLNSHGPTAMDGLSPFGGVKQSGIGRNFGLEGVRQFQEIHSISGESGQVF